MIHHIEIYVSDLKLTREFWSSLLSSIGYSETSYWEDGFTLSNGEDGYLTFVQVTKKHQSHKYHRCGVGLNHIAFKVMGKEKIDSLREYCLSKSISLLYDEKYPHANGGEDYYALFLEDPDRIKVEFVGV